MKPTSIPQGAGRSRVLAPAASSPSLSRVSASWCGECACRVEVANNKFVHECRHYHNHGITFTISTAQREAWIK